MLDLPLWSSSKLSRGCFHFRSCWVRCSRLDWDRLVVHRYPLLLPKEVQQCRMSPHLTQCRCNSISVQLELGPLSDHFCCKPGRVTWGQFEWRRCQCSPLFLRNVLSYTIHCPGWHLVTHSWRLACILFSEVLGIRSRGAIRLIVRVRCARCRTARTIYSWLPGFDEVTGS